VIIFNKPLFL